MYPVRSVSHSFPCCATVEVEEPLQLEKRTSLEMIQLAIQMKNSGEYLSPIPVNELSSDSFPADVKIRDDEVTPEYLNHHVFIEREAVNHPESTIHEVIYETYKVPSNPKSLRGTVESLRQEYEWMKLPQVINPGRGAPETSKIMVIRYADPSQSKCCR